MEGRGDVVKHEVLQKSWVLRVKDERLGLISCEERQWHPGNGSWGFMSHGTHLPQLHLPQLHIQNHHVGGLKLAVVLQGVYLHPRNRQTLQNRAFFQGTSC